MSRYTAEIYCEKCEKLLAKIEAYHEPQYGVFVPQDIMEKKYRMPSMFCQDCLNGRKGENNES